MSLSVNVSPEVFNALMQQLQGQNPSVAGAYQPMPTPAVSVNSHGIPMIGGGGSVGGTVPVLSGHLPMAPTVGIAGGGNGTFNQQSPNAQGVNPYTWPTDKYGNIIQGYPYYVRTINTGFIYGH